MPDYIGKYYNRIKESIKTEQNYSSDIKPSQIVASDLSIDEIDSSKESSNKHNERK